MPAPFSSYFSSDPKKAKSGLIMHRCLISKLLYAFAVNATIFDRYGGADDFLDSQGINNVY